MSRANMQIKCAKRPMRCQFKKLGIIEERTYSLFLYPNNNTRVSSKTTITRPKTKFIHKNTKVVLQNGILKSDCPTLQLQHSSKAIKI